MKKLRDEGLGKQRKCPLGKLLEVHANLLVRLNANIVLAGVLHGGGVEEQVEEQVEGHGSGCCGPHPQTHTYTATRKCHRDVIRNIRKGPSWTLGSSRECSPQCPCTAWGGGGGLLEFASGKQQSCRTGTDHALALAPALHVFVALLDNGCALLRRDLVVGRLQPLQTSQRLGDLRGGVTFRLVKGKCACRSARAYLLLDIGKLLLRILVGELRGQRLVLFVIGEKGVRPTEG